MTSKFSVNAVVFEYPCYKVVLLYFETGSTCVVAKAGFELNPLASAS